MNKKIQIKTIEKKYCIEIKFSFFKKKLLKLVQNKQNIFIVIDTNVDYLIKNIKFPNNVNVIKIKASEKIKNFKNYEFLINKLLYKGIDRNSLIIAIGGGTIGDLTGFVASTVLRGVKLILIPTTLLSQVDSSIGGKNGINSILGKNLIGTFYQPEEIFIDPMILKSLKIRDIRSGYAEIVKHALINDYKFFSWLDNNYNNIFKLQKDVIVYAIYKSILIKAKFVTSDTKELLVNKNSRAILNFGHTFGHALESLYKYNNSITHGEAISIGMTVASKLSNKLSTLSKIELEKIINHFTKVGLPIYDNKIRDKKIISIIKNDKKNKNNEINLILLKKIGLASYFKNVNSKIVSKHLN